ncbi:DegV family protein [Mycoplasmopsis cynos]|nr:DegV family protein [Mycoplasmopsis cynos]WQQ12801.1 DegV family protein [Mycoplasmopsis cynos]WQQ14010.1 DegV family protein [Mycoplasmopsis cynos]WQQ14927.1 DegV family protein [Mycoplasmopsis cynos]WQQ15561.1 DegV family protein [Mycoplasmopsis cynos]WQQ15884.1 DegV family protein [Mycoplasmopsis cynos]
MRKLGIIIDPFSCLNEQKANELGYKFLPLQVEIDGKTYLDGTDDRLEILKMIDKSERVLSSLPKLETIQRVVNEASKEYSDVIYLGISSNLSGTAGAIRTMATELGNVYIMENHLIGDQITRTAEYLKNLYENHNYTIDQLYEELNWINESVMNLIVPEKIDYMIKGGRLSGLKKFVLTKISMLPILSYEEDGSVKPKHLKRSVSKAVSKAIESIVEFCQSKAEHIDKDSKQKFVITFIHGIHEEINNMIYQNQYFKPTSEFLTPSVIAVHTGPEAIALGVMPELIINNEKK